METPLRGRSGGHAGTAPTVSFGRECAMHFRPRCVVWVQAVLVDKGRTAATFLDTTEKSP
ncbi:hypothetical protein [Segatella oulorum]|uniref:hypothetical protein n=1 Tax=Segatella oulorum TaxID=28136 RepID=UPI00117E6607|nr:hypothetical protein [Segatella oulorum]